MKLRIFLTAARFLGVLTLVACSGDDNEPTTTGSTSTGATVGTNTSSGAPAGAWQGEFETGTDVSLELWVDPATDPVLTLFEAFREATGGAPVLYGRATATNDGEGEDTSRFAILTAADGERFGPDAVEVGFLCSQIGRWIAVVATLTTELNDQYTKLLNEDCGGNTLVGPVIPPGETVTYYLAYEGDSEPAFERIFMGAGNELER